MPSDGNEFVLTLFTDDTTLAGAADAAGIDRIGVDLEILGKESRQAGTGSRISAHRAESLGELSGALRRATLFARCNPLHEGSEAELDKVLGHGVRTVMLPYFKSAREVSAFRRLLDGRALLVALVETVESIRALREVLDALGPGEIHFGLNDLRLAMGMRNHFDVLETEAFRHAIEILVPTGVPFGIAAVARPYDRSLPVDPAEVCRRIGILGATRVLIARSFFGPGYKLSDLPGDIALLRATLRDARRSRKRAAQLCP